MIKETIDYEHFLSQALSEDIEDVIRFLSEMLPYEWADAYIRASPHQANIWRIPYDGFEYLFDISTELVQQGIVAEAHALDDRIVAVHGKSRVN
jgi:hypothetical protein